MSVAKPTILPRAQIFPRLLPTPPQNHPLPLPQGNLQGNYAHMNKRRDLQREMDDLSEEENELEDINININQRGYSFLIPIGKTLTTQEEKNDADEEESEESASGESAGPPSAMEDDGENGSMQDLDASMEDMDEEGENSTDDEMEEGDTEEME